MAGSRIGGLGLVDDPEFVEEVVEEGMGFVPYVLMPHVDNPDFAGVMRYVSQLPEKYENMIELKDSQAAIFENGAYRIVTAEAATK